MSVEQLYNSVLYIVSKIKCQNRLQDRNLQHDKNLIFLGLQIYLKYKKSSCRCLNDKENVTG